MLTSQGRTSLVPLLRQIKPSTSYFAVRTCCDERNRISNAYSSLTQKAGPSTMKVSGSKYPTFFTRPNFVEQIKVERAFNASADIGVVPTKWQKRFLVLMHVYENQGDIPLIVAHGTMNRMHSRMRILTILLPCSVFLILSWFWAPWCNKQVEVPDGEVAVNI